MSGCYCTRICCGVTDWDTREGGQQIIARQSSQELHDGRLILAQEGRSLPGHVHESDKAAATFLPASVLPLIARGHDYSLLVGPTEEFRPLGLAKTFGVAILRRVVICT